MTVPRFPDREVVDLEIVSPTGIHMNFPPPSSSRDGKYRSKAPDPHATVAIHKDREETGEESEEDISQLPPLLQRLPQGFGAYAEEDDEDDADAAEFSGTVVIKGDRPPQRSPFSASPRDRFDEAYATFLRRSTSRPNQVSSKDDWGDGISPSLNQAVEIMKQGESQRQRQTQRQGNKMSVSSVPESITKEDPATKYELLRELGEDGSYLEIFVHQFVLSSFYAVFSMGLCQFLLGYIFLFAGKGSYGAVYEARDRTTSELVAVKVISLSEAVKNAREYS